MSRTAAGPGRRPFFKLLLKNRLALVGLSLLLLFVFVAVFVPLLAPHEPWQQNLRSRLLPPAWLEGGTTAHLLGTDQLGRDVFSRILHGASVSLQVALIAVSISTFVGVLLGALAAFYGGWLDNVISGIVDVLLALPAFLLALAIVAALGPSIVNVMIAVGIATVPAFARIMRSAVLTVREMDYVTAAEAVGSRDSRVMLKHVIPNSLGPVIVQVSLSLAGAILAAAGLSFLGMGAQPPTAEWGSMLNAARPYIRDAQWTVTFPGLAIVITVLALNLVGDGLRDALDPRRVQSE